MGSWKFDHDKNWIYLEEYEGKVIMKETTEHKYIGLVNSNNVSNVPSILNEKGEVKRKQIIIISIFKWLGSQTVEFFLIYLKTIWKNVIVDFCVSSVLYYMVQISKHVVGVLCLSIDHDKNWIYLEEYEGKFIMKETTEHKYLGLVISNNASNVPNLLNN